MNNNAILAIACSFALASCGGGGAPPSGEGEPPPAPPQTIAFNMDAAYASALAGGVSFDWMPASGGSSEQLALSYEPTTDGQFLGTSTTRAIRRISSCGAAGAAATSASVTISYTVGPTVIAGVVDVSGLPTKFAAAGSFPTAGLVGQSGRYAQALTYAAPGAQQVVAQMQVGWSLEADSTANTAWACLSFTPQGGSLQEKQCLRIDPAGAILGAKIERHAAAASATFVGQQPTSPTPVRYTLLEPRTLSPAGAPAPAFATIRDAASWEAFWAAYGSARPPLPVDLSQQMIVAAVVGERPDSCWQLDLVSVAEAPDRITVRYQDAHNDMNVCSYSVQTPLLLAAIPVSEKPVQWVATTPDPAIFRRPDLSPSRLEAWYDLSEPGPCRLLHLAATLTPFPPEPDPSPANLSVRALRLVDEHGAAIVSNWSTLSVGAGTSTYQVTAAGCPAPADASSQMWPVLTVGFHDIERQLWALWPVTPQSLACHTPAPLYGLLDPRVPGYIVMFTDGVDASAETQRLAAKYGFQPKFVYTALGGFAAVLADDVLAAVRCEPTVKYVEYEGLVETF